MHAMKLFLPKILFFLLCLPQAVFADQAAVALLADKTIVQAGSSLRLGAHFKLEPGWHIYWKDPGESGLATSLKFEGPDGFTSSEIFWPQHEQFVSTGNIKSNGYSKEVLLWREIKIPTGVVGEQKLKLKVSWLNCSAELCVPERKTLEHIIFIGEDKASADAATFDIWAAKLPKLDGLE